MKTWRCAGSTALTRSPRSELSTGMSRQPIRSQPFRGDRLGDDRLGAGARLGVARHEELADGVMSRLGQGEAELGAFLREEAVGDLGQHAAAVAERRVGADRAAMVEIDQDLQALLENGVRGAALHVGDDADAAGIALAARGRRDPARAAATGRRPASGT